MTAAGYDFDLLHRNIVHVLSQLFHSATSTIGSFPRSRALHAIDLMVDTSLQPYILEVPALSSFLTVGSPAHRRSTSAQTSPRRSSACRRDTPTLSTTSLPLFSRPPCPRPCLSCRCIVHASINSNQCIIAEGNIGHALTRRSEPACCQSALPRTVSAHPPWRLSDTSPTLHVCEYLSKQRAQSNGPE